ncbi:MAG: haloacid dehalogenase-like hydrolase [Planctomycetaceae bacterium]
MTPQLDHETAQKSSHWPIVVDLDGTLTPANTLLVSLLLALKKNPLILFLLPFWVLPGRASFKCKIAAHAVFSAEKLVYCSPLLDYLRREQCGGRKVILATAAHVSIANAVAAHLGLFSDVLATEAGRNLKGGKKLEAIRCLVGPEFVYAGDSKADLPIWKAAKAAILVGVKRSVVNSLGADVTVECVFAHESVTTTNWLKMLLTLCGRSH